MKTKPKANKPIASLSLDLDNIWSYLKNQGAPGWESFPSYLDIAVPRFLEILQQWNLTITVFIVGQDAALEKNHKAIQAIANAGHEIGNHSFHHDPWLHLYSENEIEEEVALAEEHIKRVTYQHPVGFRGPGYSFSPAVLKVLARRGYEYDASTFPTILGPIARAYYLMTCKLSKEERKKREALFGSFKDGLQPLKPYQWNMGKDKLTEIPVTTMPIFKVPIHFSYIMYLTKFSSDLALFYLRIALWLCKLTRTQPSLLLHPTDFLSQEDVPELSFFPGMNVPTYKKLAVVNKSLELISTQFNVLTVGQHANSVAGVRKLPVLVPHKR
ncbi:polysaccharide deacetylase family protein [Desmonostoc muscorum LEGE 12446]|uniref:Polysaccharide deacetylase family protein n=1 Tax=Desmonostoc muscorum LEGE 12446 TaxID=1828758 RepID=A0A8J7DIL3_DESMC|nr:polysaccharide deacetylase family protein [Desmonostoc muscorum]MCF2149232.1 polysaccharide deacetylase family protein [Desmonostoc muscorum LEGE 12446]